MLPTSVSNSIRHVNILCPEQIYPVTHKIPEINILHRDVLRQGIFYRQVQLRHGTLQSNIQRFCIFRNLHRLHARHGQTVLFNLFCCLWKKVPSLIHHQQFLHTVYLHKACPDSLRRIIRFVDTPLIGNQIKRNFPQRHIIHLDRLLQHGIFISGKITQPVHTVNLPVLIQNHPQGFDAFVGEGVRVCAVRAVRAGRKAQRHLGSAFFPAAPLATAPQRSNAQDRQHINRFSHNIHHSIF